jgi:hypothetical protein
MDTNTTQFMPVETPPGAKANKPIYKRWWVIALAAGGRDQRDYEGGEIDSRPGRLRCEQSRPVMSRNINTQPYGSDHV